MLIQIGLPCDPEWLCSLIGWVVAGLMVLLLIGLIRTIRRETRNNKSKRKKVT